MFCSQFDTNFGPKFMDKLERQIIQNQTIFNYILMIINQNILAILRAFLNLY